ncbi:hypothetical protein [Gellertiella hungarica]|uniref:Uncharacterized protein n=1 Tax=Gellertiella hungarica TaxID=1572859 RepID=A0A7W6J8J4_9HYPH|nr:hypothetical protein [Gellertiella hungarica]MBB4066791.1 hypothetical protein [Gellertiella hungarica]
MRPPFPFTLAEMPIHPANLPTPAGGRLITHGLTMREHFAGLAMQGIASKYPFGLPNMGGYPTAEAIAVTAVSYADALIAELAKTEGGDA